MDAVLFDLDGTLCAHPRSADERLVAAFERAGVDPFFDATDWSRWAPKVTGTTPLDFRERCFTGIAREQGRDADLGRAVARAYEDPDPREVEPLPGALVVLDALEHRYDLGLVTNGGRETQAAKLDALGIRDRFDALVFATPEEALKPDPYPFERALSALGVGPDRTVHVGNSLESDVAGAHAAGLDAVWYSPDGGDPGDHEPAHVVSSLSDLADPPW